MYKNFYGLRDKPFSLTPDSEYLFLGDHHREALNFLHEGIRDDFNLIALSGIIGSGKTILLRSFLKNLADDIKIIQVFYPTSSNIQLLQMILLNIGIKTIHEDLSSLRNDVMNHINNLFEKHKHILLIIDEAQNLKRESLDEVYRIIEPQDNINSVKALLVGLPDLIQNLSGIKAKTHLRDTCYSMGNLPLKEVSPYINGRLAIAGRSDATIFPEETISEISLASGGVPRVINIICEAALSHGYASGSKSITRSALKEVLRDLHDIIGPGNINAETKEIDRDDAKEPDAALGAPHTQRLMIPDSLSLRIHVLERNARMRVHLDDHFQQLGYNAVITDSFDNLIKTLSRNSIWEIQIIVLDWAFFLPESGKEDPAARSALDRIQTTYAYVPLIITAILPLTTMRETLLKRGISCLLKKPDLNQIDLAGLKESVDAFFNELQNTMANIQSQYNSFLRDVIKWSIEHKEHKKPSL